MGECGRIRVGISVCAALAIAAASGPRAQDTAERSVIGGVYSKEQAAAGKKLYSDTCSSCHMENLSGDTMSPAMVGEEFISKWENKPLRALYSRIISTMPSDSPGTLAEKTVVDIVAYLLEVNGFPAGNKALERADELNTIKVTRAKQP
jgi:mono/diheme cytochrome c family protein